MRNRIRPSWSLGIGMAAATAAATSGCVPVVELGSDDAGADVATPDSSGGDSAKVATPEAGTDGSIPIADAGVPKGPKAPTALLVSCRIEKIVDDADALYFFRSKFGECDGRGRPR